MELKRAFLVDSETAFGIEIGAKLPTAKDSIGSGKADYTVNTIFSKDFGKVHMDANANVTRLGAWEAGTGRNQARPGRVVLDRACGTLGRRRRIVGHASQRHGQHRPTAGGGDVQSHQARHFRYRRRAQLARRIGNWSLFGGMVVPLAKLW